MCGKYCWYWRNLVITLEYLAMDCIKVDNCSVVDYSKVFEARLCTEGRLANKNGRSTADMSSSELAFGIGSMAPNRWVGPDAGRI
jgi:hypothetical protein